MAQLMTIIKKAVRKLARQAGYDLIKSDVNEQLCVSFVKEIEDVYRFFLLKDLPESGPARLKLMGGLLGTRPGEALYILHALSQTMALEGDVCEFGVAQGATSALLANEIRDSNKTLWLFDSFSGLPKPTEKDQLKDDIFGLGSMDSYEGTMACGVDMVQDRLRAINFPTSRIKIVPGFIEETIKRSGLPGKVSFAYVDFDFYEPILVALKYLDSVSVPGAYIVVDDYDFFSTGAKTAVEEFLSTRQENYVFSKPIPPAGHFCLLRKVK